MDLIINSTETARIARERGENTEKAIRAIDAGIRQLQLDPAKRAFYIAHFEDGYLDSSYEKAMRQTWAYMGKDAVRRQQMPTEAACNLAAVGQVMCLEPVPSIPAASIEAPLNRRLRRWDRVKFWYSVCVVGIACIGGAVIVSIVLWDLFMAGLRALGFSI